MRSDYFILVFDQIPSGTAQMKRANHKTGVFFKSKTLLETECKYMDQLMEYKPKAPLEGPVSLSISFYYTVKSKKLKGKYKTSRGDLDNIAKILIDCMTKTGFWKDDAQIVRLSLSKQYSTKAEAEIYVTYREVEDD